MSSYLKMQDVTDGLAKEGITDFVFLDVKQVNNNGICKIVSSKQPSDKLMNYFNSKIACPFHIKWEKP